MWLNPKLKYLHTARPSRGAKRLSATAGLMNGSAHFALSLSSRAGSLFLIAKLSHSSHNFMLLRLLPLSVQQWVIGWAAYVYGILPFVITARMHRG